MDHEFKVQEVKNGFVVNDGIDKYVAKTPDEVSLLVKQIMSEGIEDKEKFSDELIE